jgi:cytosine/adenosine deaminase-related metal-dependent hydrolase
VSHSRQNAVIRARWIVPLHGPPLEGGWLRIRRGRVVDLGAGSPPGRRDDASAIDAADAIVIPGLVNAHTHLEFSDVDPPLDAAGGLPGWIERVVALRRGRPSGTAADRQVAAAIRRGLDESAAHGVTAVGEISTGIPVGGYPAGGPRLRIFREALGLSAASATTAVFPEARRDDEDTTPKAADRPRHQARRPARTPVAGVAKRRTVLRALALVVCADVAVRRVAAGADGALAGARASATQRRRGCGGTRSAAGGGNAAQRRGAAR